MPLTNPAQPSPLLEQLFEPGVVTAELRVDAEPALVHPQETAACATFAPTRRADFVAGRLCAHRVLAELGIEGFPIAINADRSPRWPPQIVGSISHTAGFRCAVAAHRESYAAIGVDAEIAGRVTADIEPLVFTAAEVRSLDMLPSPQRAYAATIVFGAKEAFFKFQYPRTGQWLEFCDVTVELAASDFRRGAFAVRSRIALPALGARSAFEGRFVVDGELVLTGIALRTSAKEAAT